MENMQISKFIKQISATSLKAVEEVASEKKDLTPDSMYAVLNSSQEFKNLVDAFANQDSLEQDVSSQSSLEIKQLKTRFITLRNQKESLLKDFSKLEKYSADLEEFYHRALLVLFGMINTRERKSLNQHIDELKKLIKTGSNFKQLEHVFHQFKDTALKDGIRVGENRINRAKPFSFFSKLLKTSLPGIKKEEFNAGYLKQIRESCLDITDKLKLNLSKKYLEKLVRIEQRISQSENIEELHDLRGSIFALINEYIENIRSEQHLAGEFIREIGQRLLNIEEHLLDSLSPAEETFASDSDFVQTLGETIKELKGKVNFGETIEELKHAFTDKLTEIEKTIRNKSEEDNRRKNTFTKSIKLLRCNLIDMKKEIAAAKKESKMLEQEMLNDPLTGAFNRRAYDRRIKEEMDRYLRYKRPFSLLLFDVDHFKNINDTYGHAIGDKCLIEIIQRIKTNIRASDFLGRYGGDEFAVILPETSSENARIVAEKLRQVVGKIEFIYNKETVRITLSIGVTHATPSDTSFDFMFERLDKAMYEAKNSGRDRVVVL